MSERGGLGLESVLVASRRQVACELGDEVVILSLRTGEYYGLNAVAARIWSLVQQPRSVTELRDVLLGEYSEVSPEQCAREVLEVVTQMLEQQLVEVRESADPA